MQTIKAYAKINLCLLIGPKKENLHKIKSIFQLHKELFDEIEIEQSKTVEINYYDSDHNKIEIENCIIQKALNFLKTEFNISDQYKINIYKNIPIGSGLGGGSSDAAAIIYYIAMQHNIDIKKVLLKSYAVGSDVPFFISGYDTAIVKNLGEKIKELDITYPKYKLQLTELSCSTKEVFSAFDTFKNKRHSLLKQVKYLKKGQYDKLINDLEKPCFMVYKKMYNIKDELSKNFIVKLSGSGSTFILFDKKVE